MNKTDLKLRGWSTQAINLLLCKGKKLTKEENGEIEYLDELIETIERARSDYFQERREKAFKPKWRSF